MMSDETALQRESRTVNELNGVVAHLVGVLDRVMRSKTLEEAKSCAEMAAQNVAEMAAQNVAEYHAGLWKPGPGDDPADWRAKR